MINISFSYNQYTRHSKAVRQNIFWDKTCMEKQRSGGNRNLEIQWYGETQILGSKDLENSIE